MKRLISIIIILMAAFALITGVSAVYAMSASPSSTTYFTSAYFAEGAEAISRCEFSLALDSTEDRFLARYSLKNDSDKPIVVKVRQPLEHGSTGKLTAEKGVITVRHTYYNGYYLDAEEKPLISDVFIKDNFSFFYSPDMAVYKQVYKVTELGAPTAVACLTYDGISGTKVVLKNGGTFKESRGKLQCYVTAYKNAELVVYEIGERIEPNISFYDNMQTESVAGKAEKVKTEEITFRQFVASYNKGEASEIDYYNAVINKLYSYAGRYYFEYGFDLSHGNLLEWRCVEIPLKAGEQTYVEFSDSISTVKKAGKSFYEIKLYPSFPIKAELNIDAEQEFTTSSEKNENGKYMVDSNGFSISVDYGKNALPSEFLKFVLGFFGRIIAIPISFILTKLIVRKYKIQ